MFNLLHGRFPVWSECWCFSLHSAATAAAATLRPPSLLNECTAFVYSVAPLFTHSLALVHSLTRLPISFDRMASHIKWAHIICARFIWFYRLLQIIITTILNGNMYNIKMYNERWAKPPIKYIHIYIYIYITLCACDEKLYDIILYCSANAYIYAALNEWGQWKRHARSILLRACLCYIFEGIPMFIVIYFVFSKHPRVHQFYA